MIKYASPLKIFYAILCSTNIIFELFISTYTGIKLSFYAENNMGSSRRALMNFFNMANIFFVYAVMIFTIIFILYEVYLLAKHRKNMGLSKFFIVVNVLLITASRYIAALGAYIPQVHSDIYSLCYVNMIVLVWLILYKVVSIPILKKVSK